MCFGPKGEASEKHTNTEVHAQIHANTHRPNGKWAAFTARFQYPFVTESMATRVRLRTEKFTSIKFGTYASDNKSVATCRCEEGQNGRQAIDP